MARVTQKIPAGRDNVIMEVGGREARLTNLGKPFWPELGLSGLRLELNTIGSAEERARHRADLVAYLQAHEGRLDADAKRRLHTNPLRILDSKKPEMHENVQGAPQLLGRLSGASRAHFDSLQQILADNGVAFEINPRLIGGMRIRVGSDVYDTSVRARLAALEARL